MPITAPHFKTELLRETQPRTAAERVIETEGRVFAEDKRAEGFQAPSLRQILQPPSRKSARCGALFFSGLVRSDSLQGVALECYPRTKRISGGYGFHIRKSRDIMSGSPSFVRFGTAISEGR